MSFTIEFEDKILEVFTFDTSDDFTKDFEIDDIIIDGISVIEDFLEEDVKIIKELVEAEINDHRESFMIRNY